MSGIIVSKPEIDTSLNLLLATSNADVTSKLPRLLTPGTSNPVVNLSKPPVGNGKPPLIEGISTLSIIPCKLSAKAGVSIVSIIFSVIDVNLGASAVAFAESTSVCSDKVSVTESNWLFRSSGDNAEKSISSANAMASSNVFFCN